MGGAYLWPQKTAQSGMDTPLYGDCHIKLKEVQFNERKIMGEGIMDTAGSC